MSALAADASAAQGPGRNAKTTTPGEVKSATRAHWDQAASGWDHHGPQIGAWLAAATDAMLDMAGVQVGSQVLDVAAGAGGQTLDIARRVGPGGSVLATDLSPGIIACARRNASLAGLSNVRTEVADGENLPLADETFDAVVSRLGLMFFPDPLRGLLEMRRVLRPGGGICTMVFSTPQRNPCVAIVMSTALEHAGVPPGDPFQPGGLLSLGRAGGLDELFHQAGLRQIATTALEAPFRLPSAKAYLDFVRASASPIRGILATLEPAAAQAAWDDMEERLSVFATAAGWEGPNEMLLTAARR